MRKLSLLFMALLATTALWASNVITYTANKKLAEVQEGKFRFGGAIHVDAFNVPISSHTFSDGIGTITFAGEVTTIGEQAFYQCNFTSITIPNSVDSIGEEAFRGCGLLTITLPESVTGIGNSAFADCDSLASVTFPDSINIGVYAFSQCHSLRSINFGKRANSIEYSAFRGCDSLSTLTISSGVTRIEDLAFSDCPSLKTVFWNAKKCDLGSLIFNQSWQIESFVFGDSVQEIPNSLCSRLVKLTTISIPNSVTKIGASAFASCAGFTSIIIPNNVSYIGNNAFEYCTGVASITVPDGVSYVGTAAFYGIKNLIYHGSLTDAPWGACCLNGTLEGNLIFSDATKKKLCSCLTTATGAIDIPNTVDTIADCAFAGCTSITSISNPKNVSYIGNSAFEGCTGLKSVTIPNSVTYIGSYAFSGCTSLQSVSLPQNLKRIPSYMFSGCESLTDISIPNSVTNVGEFAFYGCISFPVVNNLRYADTYLVEVADQTLSTYAIKDGTKWIGTDAFNDCYNLTSITIPSSVTSIGQYAFYWCPSLKSITIPNSVTSIGERAFEYCTSLKTITLPNSVTSIGRGVFYYCRSLSSITIPASVISIGERAFALCDSLATINVDRDNTKFSSIDGVLFNYEKDSLIQYPMGNPRTSYTIPNGVTRIGIWSFYKQYDYNSPLQAITIPSSVTHIGKCAFVYCTTITSITCYAITPPTCGERCFDQVDKSIPINIPGGCAEDYKKAEEWKDFTNFVSIFPFGKCGSDLRWNYADGTLSISGTGSMYNYTTDDTAPWMQFYKDSITNIVIANGATSIGDYAFYGLSNKNFKKTDLPNSVTTIGQYAFANCTYLKNMTMGTDVEEIKAKAFDNDQKLLYVTCYTLEPPTLATDAFVNWDANLNVPCEAVADYKMSVGWKLFNKDNITCIGADPTTTTDVTVTPTDNSATITWPTNSNADSYTIVIEKNGITFCTLTFNAQGQLTNIAFAPGRGSSNDVAMAEAVAGGYKFTITSLDPGTKYTYEIDTQNASGTSIANYTGTFTTTGGSTSLYQLPDSEFKIQNSKFIRDGQLYILRDDKMYNALGGEL